MPHVPCGETKISDNSVYAWYTQLHVYTLQKHRGISTFSAFINFAVKAELIFSTAAPCIVYRNTIFQGPGPMLFL